MILRRVIEHAKAQNWTAVALAVIGMQIVFFKPASADALPSDELPQYVLDACDVQAMSFGEYDKKIAASVEALTDMGVFSAAEFYNVKVGFCDLRRARGPAATTSCARDIILLDSGYAGEDQSLVRNATLAHEMKHVFQHREQKAARGESYCSSKRYHSDKEWMETEADAFGDSVAELFFTGRSVEIKNECPVTTSVYLEADTPLSANEDPLKFFDVAPYSTVRSPERAISKFFKIYAVTQSDRRQEQIWGGPAMAYKRFINGALYGLQQVTLDNSKRTEGPFQMVLSCPPDRSL